MGKTANLGLGDEYKPLEDPAYTEKYSYNDLQRAGSLVRQILHKDAYGISIMAQQRQKVLELQKELVGMGLPPAPVLHPDFDDEERLEEYANLSAYRKTKHQKS